MHAHTFTSSYHFSFIRLFATLVQDYMIFNLLHVSSQNIYLQFTCHQHCFLFHCTLQNSFILSYSCSFKTTIIFHKQSHVPHALLKLCCFFFFPNFNINTCIYSITLMPERFLSIERKHLGVANYPQFIASYLLKLCCTDKITTEPAEL